MERRLERLEVDKNEYRRQSTQDDVKIEKLNRTLTQTVDKGLANAKRVIDLEIENGQLQSEVRHRGQIINDYEIRFDTQIEEIELLNYELEEQKEVSERIIFELQRQVQALKQEVWKKKREARKRYPSFTRHTSAPISFLNDFSSEFS